MPGTRHGRLAPIGVVLLATFAAVGVAEVALRLAGSPTALQSEWVLTHPDLVFVPDMIVARRAQLAPSMVSPAPPPIILTIGDSFTAGYPVGREKSYPSVLGRILARRGLAVTIRNASMGDTGPDHQFRLLETRLLPKLRPDVVVWQLYANDVWDNVLKPLYRVEDGRLVPVSGAHNWITRRQRFFDGTPLPADLKIGSRVFRLLLHAFEPRGRRGVKDALVEPSLARIALELRAFSELAEVHGFIPYVLLVPPQSVYLRAREAGFDDSWSIGSHELLAALVQDRPDFIDGYLGAGSGDRCFDTDRDPAERGHRHLNERGYARLAHLVARRLLRDGVLTRPRADADVVSGDG